MESVAARTASPLYNNPAPRRAEPLPSLHEFDEFLLGSIKLTEIRIIEKCDRKTSDVFKCVKWGCQNCFKMNAVKSSAKV